MGEVYRATDTRLGRDVAIKVLPTDVASRSDRLARFEREAKAVASLNHPNIVVLYSIEEAGEVRFLTMELVEGKSLDHYLEAGGLPVPRVLEIVGALADALVAAHDRGIVHRDLKPANVMITRDGRVKMLDFGLAKLSAAEAVTDASETITVAAPISALGQVVGTVPYMAPEQVRGEPADARTDLFSLGVMLYEMLTGTRPFVGATVADLGSAILRDAPPPLLDVRANLPRDLDRIVTRCLEKDRERRLQTAKDLRNELDFVRRSLESGTSGSSASRVPTAPVPSKHAAPLKEAPSIAVLPFVNRSRNEEDEYFADGLADELLTVLAKIRGLRVAARTSSFRFKGVHEDTAVIGEKLNVATILEGSLRKSGNRVRISVQLVKVADGYHLWSETYDRTLDDIFAVQDDIAQSVVKELRTTLLGDAPDSKASGDARIEVAAAAKGRGTDTEAHRLFLQGRYLVNRSVTQDVASGIDYLERAVELDPTNAVAWAVLAGARTLTGITGMGPLDENIDLARAAARRALELEPHLAEAHLAMAGPQQWYDFDWDAAERSVRRALELAPSSADALRAAGMLAVARGRGEEGLTLFRRAVERDPLSVSAYIFYGRACATMGQAAEAEAALRKALEFAPNANGVHSGLGVILYHQERFDEALAAALREPAEWARLTSLAIVYHGLGRDADSELALSQLIERHGHEAAFQVAEVHAVRGDIDGAFRWLDTAYAQRDSGLIGVKLNRLLRPLHGDPRWWALHAKLGVAD